ncbi:MAG TPA: DUF4296 domain-containing protein [Flavisolibacter sp.]
MLLSCSGDEIPEDVLDRGKMEDVMWDMLRADEMLSVYSERGATFPGISQNTDLYDKVFRMHGIDKKHFHRSLEFYQSNPDIFQEVLDSLKTRSDSAVATPPPPRQGKPALIDTLQ